MSNLIKNLPQEFRDIAKEASAISDGKMSKDDFAKLEKMVSNHALIIINKIKEQDSKIQKAKEKAESARDVAKKNTFWNSIKQKTTFGLAGINITDERSRLTAEGLVETNEALSKINEIIRDIVNFTCVSAYYAKTMVDTLGGIIVSGFEDASGQRQQLSKSQKEFVQVIINEAKEKAGQKLQVQQNTESIAQNRESINNNAQSILLNKDLIARNAELIAQNQQKILELQKNTNKNLRILVWLALVLSITSLIVSLANKF